MEEHVGLIGCGIIGSAIAQGLIDHAYEVIAFDKSTHAMSRSGKIGYSTAATPAAVAFHSEVFTQSSTVSNVPAEYT
jgi:3-hydroxyisobutyrate dehydrogenase-like beta-hydroxyacid dehydrogenase